MLLFLFLFLLLLFSFFRMEEEKKHDLVVAAATGVAPRYAAGQLPALTAPLTTAALLKLTGPSLILRSLMQPT